MTQDRVRKYIKFLREIYIVAPKIQPNFWEAVEKKCLNPNCTDFVRLLNDNPCCLIKYYNNTGTLIPVLNYVPTNSVEEFVEQIVNEIIQMEATVIDPLDYFILKRKYEQSL